MQQQGELIRVEAVARGRSVEDGGYLWSGELRLWDNEILMGWYTSVDSSVRSKGTLYFVLHPQGLEMTRPLGRPVLRREGHHRPRVHGSHRRRRPAADPRSHRGRRGRAAATEASS